MVSISRMRCLHALAVAALLAGAGVHVPTGQSQPTGQVPAFRVRTDVVQLDVSVLDERGLPVPGLSAADFTVLEGGVPQPVAGFAAIEVPTWSAGTAPWMRDVAPDVASNRLDARRAVVIVLDDFGTRWDPGVTRVVKSIAGAAIEQLGPADLAAVVYVLNRAHGQEFTLDRTRLRAAVERFTPSGLPPASGWPLHGHHADRWSSRPVPESRTFRRLLARLCQHGPAERRRGPRLVAGRT